MVRHVSTGLERGFSRLIVRYSAGQGASLDGIGKDTVIIDVQIRTVVRIRRTNLY